MNWLVHCPYFIVCASFSFYLQIALVFVFTVLTIFHKSAWNCLQICALILSTYNISCNMKFNWTVISGGVLKVLIQCSLVDLLSHMLVHWIILHNPMLICSSNSGTYEIYGKDHAHLYCEYVYPIGVTFSFSSADLYVLLSSLKPLHF